MATRWLPHPIRAGRRKTRVRETCPSPHSFLNSLPYFLRPRSPPRSSGGIHPTSDRSLPPAQRKEVESHTRSRKRGRSTSPSFLPFLSPPACTVSLPQVGRKARSPCCEGGNSPFLFLLFRPASLSLSIGGGVRKRQTFACAPVPPVGWSDSCLFHLHPSRAGPAPPVIPPPVPPLSEAPSLFPLLT